MAGEDTSCESHQSFQLKLRQLQLKRLCLKINSDAECKESIRVMFSS